MAFRLRLHLEPDQSEVFVRHCADARFVWNLGLEQRNFWTKGLAPRLPKLSMTTQAKSLTEARQFTWLGEGSSWIQQAALRDLDRAFQNWWKNPSHFGRPTWRKAGVNEGFYIRDLSIKRLNRKWGTVLIPKCGWVKFRLGGRAWCNLLTATSARITQDRVGRWWVSFTAPQLEVERTTTGSMVGIDMGIAHTVTTSNGEHLDLPELLSPGERARKLRLQRRLARRVKGSNRRERTRKSLARVRIREADRRKDWIEKTTTQLVRDHDFIAIEDLRVENMSRSARGTKESPGRNVRQKAGLNREIRNQAWAMFRQRLIDKATAATSPVTVVAVNPVNTSRRCSGCGHTAPDNRESQAVFRCQACNHTANADVNAAMNILAAGLAVNGRGGDVRPSSHLLGSPVEASTSSLTPTLVGAS